MLHAVSLFSGTPGCSFWVAFLWTLTQGVYQSFPGPCVTCWTANMGQSWLMELHGGRMQTEELFCSTDNPLLCLLHKSDVAALRCWLPFPWGSSEPVCKQYPSLMQGAGYRTAQAPGLCMQLGGCFLQLFEESVFGLSANSVCVCFPSNSMNRCH